MVKVSEPYEAENEGATEDEPQTIIVVDVTYPMVKEQYDYIQRLLERNPWMGDLETFIHYAIVKQQESYTLIDGR